MTEAAVAMQQVGTAAQAVVVALDWQSSPETRRNATAYLDSLKAGDVRLLATVAFGLVKHEQTSEIRHFGLKMLQHLIRMRWDELNPEEQHQMAIMAGNMLQESARPSEPWGLKSQAAALMAEVARREGPPLWKEMLPALFSLSSSGPIHAELVAMVLRWLPEDVTVHNEDLEGERRRNLLQGLTQTLPETLPFLYKLLEQHFGAAMAAVQQKELEIAKQHAAAVTATVNAVAAYAEWAPVTSLANYGLTQACGFLLRSVEFRLSACEVLKLIAARRRPVDDTAMQFDSAMEGVFEILYTAWVATEDDEEFAVCFCEAMVALGSQNLYCVAQNELKLTVYLQQMLAFLQHPNLAVHSLALPLWTTLLRESSAAMAATGATDQMVNGQVSSGTASDKEKEKKSYSFIVPAEICSNLLDVAYWRLIKKGQADGTPQDESASQESLIQIDYSQFRSRLVDLIRQIAGQRPILAASNVAQRLDIAFNATPPSGISAQHISTLEATQMMLESVVHGIPDTSMAAATSSLALKSELGSIMEGLLQRLLAVQWHGPVLVELHSRHFDAMGPFLKHSPAIIPVVVQKLFSLLESLPIPKGHAEFSREVLRSRLQVCTSFLRLARAAESALLPHLQAIAHQMIVLQQQGLLLQSETNLIGESLLVLGSAAGGEQQSLVLEWLLGPLRQQWLQPEWQEHFLSSPGGLVQLLTQRPGVPVDQNTKEPESEHNGQMWSVYHTITFFERALRRCTPAPSGKTSLTTQPVSSDTSNVDMDGSVTATAGHPMVAHLAWILPPLLKILRCMHALWSPSIVATLPTQLQEALAMGDTEQASLLGETASRATTGAFFGSDELRVDSSGVSNIEGNTVRELRTWLKGVRDSGYNVIGIAAVRLGEGFFDDSGGRAAALATALLENLESMQINHIRYLLHAVVIPMVRSCPRSHWDPWLRLVLPPILIHCYGVLSTAWTSLLEEGTIKVPGKWGHGSSAQEMKTEVMKDKLLRDLTRETCHLLSTAASTAFNPSPTTPEQQSHGEGTSMDVVGIQFSISDSLIGFIMQHQDAASAALRIGIEALEWPDSESVHKAIVFCGAVVNIAVLGNEPNLHEVVGKDMFTAALRGLTLASNASAQAELMGLLREIYVRISAQSSAPRQVLLSLPSITPEGLGAFEVALSQTASAKEQRQQMKSFLLAAGGDQLKALKPQKNTSIITNVSNRNQTERGVHRDFANREELGGTMGLAAIL